MTQEELDALMNADDSDLDSATTEEAPKKEEKPKKEEEAPAPPPPPPSSDNKMVDQLDDVTRESEQHAVEMFDSIEVISQAMMDMEAVLSEDAPKVINNNIDIFEKLIKSFPQVTPFFEAKKANENLLGIFNDLVESLQSNSDELMMIMDKMQYQDIHRQKIERVVNIMRSLAMYMNHLFSSSRDDSTRTSSAKHIPGDNATEDLVDNTDIEALLASFGK